MCAGPESLNSLYAAGMVSFMHSSDSNDDDDIVVPEAAVYESSSGGISDTRNDLLEKGETRRTA